MGATYELSTTVGQVRLMIPDKDMSNVFFQDEELSYFLSAEGAHVKRAAAAALEVMASDETMVQKKIKTLDLTTDGPAVSKDLRERAADLRRQADEDEMNEDGGIEVIEFADDVFTRREKVAKESQRS